FIDTICIRTCHNKGTFISNSSKSVKTKRCPDGYTRFEESCYLLNNEVSSWIEAYQICKIFDSRLVEVDSSEENTFIQGYLNEHGQQKGRMITTFTYRGNYGSREIEYRGFPGYWIGGQSMELPGHWYWGKSMKKVDFSILGSHAVDITDSSCLFLDRANLYQAGNKPCYTVMYSVCEKAPYTV
ncbi:C-type lectin domain family 7 member A-like, partial [Saccostrea cucullata]|uniref:C-type lectin domain family 7 member A-like n=1 Tax=Saccostrea cuccullata TaxID=36930 RepID=UPI002ED45131